MSPSTFGDTGLRFRVSSTTFMMGPWEDKEDSFQAEILEKHDSFCLYKITEQHILCY